MRLIELLRAHVRRMLAGARAAAKEERATLPHARAATAEDFPAVRALFEGETEGGHFTGIEDEVARDRFMRQIMQSTLDIEAGTPASHHLQILEVGHEVVGFLILRGESSDRCELHVLVIAPPYRRRGYARETAKGVVNAYRSQGVRVLVRCLPASMAMMGLLESLGFECQQGAGVTVRHYLSPASER